MELVVMMKNERLRERIADLEHEQWIEWSKELSIKEDLTKERVERWKKFWIPYEELSETVKEFDRKWADKTIMLLGEAFHREYNKVLVHRHYCHKWEKGERCLDCFGGGMTMFFKKVMGEI
jgi:hypothetical protein